MTQNFPIPNPRRHLEPHHPRLNSPPQPSPWQKKVRIPLSHSAKPTSPNTLCAHPPPRPQSLHRICSRTASTANTTARHTSRETQLTPSPSQVPHDRRAPNLHGHDGLLQDADAPACASPAEHAEIRPCWYVVQLDPYLPWEE